MTCGLPPPAALALPHRKGVVEADPRVNMRRRPPLVAQEGEGELARRDQAAPLLGGRLCRAADDHLVMLGLGFGFGLGLGSG